MKQITIIILLFLTFNTYGQKPEILAEPKVDERVELLSIVFRLADSREYSSKMFPKYVENIEEHFKLYKNHELINYIKKNLRKKGIGYDAVMFMAISISDKYPFQPIVPFSNENPEKRWGKKKASKFLQLLNSFYTDTDCQKFFESNQTLYKTASTNFKKVYDELDIKWYQEFYGQKPKGEFRIVNGLGNGGGNYGPSISINGKEFIYAIMGTWSVDSLGVPLYEVDDYFPTLLHEFNHSFVNHIVEKYHTELSKSGKTIYDVLKDEMESQAYGTWQTMYAEAVVRASVIKYLKEHNYPNEFIQTELNDEINRGFLWTDELVQELERYDHNRDKFPTLESFMPEIVKFFDKVANNIIEIEKEIDKRRPVVVEMKPFENGSQTVNHNIKKMEILFDRPLKGKGYSINEVKKGDKAFPEMGEITYSEDNKSVFIEIDLKPDKEYQFVLTGWSFKSEDGYGMNNYEINFKTKKE
ncbi:MAG: DUF4932 domain-containing protein [Flavobacteriales bacterium]|nr:DUF4932 domain-containing protein [Flavobacteriales bacterium]